MELLQINAMDATFTLKDVTYIMGGAIIILANYYYIKFKMDRTWETLVNYKVEKDKECETHKATWEKLFDNLEEKVKDNEELAKEKFNIIDKKLDRLISSINDLTIEIRSHVNSHQNK